MFLLNCSYSAIHPSLEPCITNAMLQKEEMKPKHKGHVLLGSVPGKWRTSTTGIQLLKPTTFCPSVQNHKFQHHPSSCNQERGLCDIHGSPGNGTFPFLCWNHGLIQNCSPKIKLMIASCLATQPLFSIPNMSLHLSMFPVGQQTSHHT